MFCIPTIGLKFRLAIFNKHGNYFLQVAVNLIQRFTLRVRAGEAGNKTDEQSGLWATFDNSRVNFHDHTQNEQYAGLSSCSGFNSSES